MATAINLDLLKKLTRLANHNPNEHEANSAARRVCQMLEGADFSLGVGEAQPPPRTSQPSPSDWFDVLAQIQREQRESYRQKQKERQAREAADNFKRQTESRPKPEEPEYHPWSAQGPRRPKPRAAKDFWGKGQGPVDVHFDYEPPSPHFGPPPRDLECTVCHKTKETFYVGNLYVCGECQGNEFRRKEKP